MFKKIKTASEEFELELQQEAFISDNSETYQAFALDKNGDEYNVFWKIIDFESDDESHACDWDNPIEIVKL